VVQAKTRRIQIDKFFMAVFFGQKYSTIVPRTTRLTLFNTLIIKIFYQSQCPVKLLAP